MFKNNANTVLMIISASVISVIVWNMAMWKAGAMAEPTGIIANVVISILILTLAFMFIGWILQNDKMMKLGLESGALEERLGYRSDLVEVMTASEQRSIILADKWERVLFANREAAARIKRDSESLIGAPLSGLFGERRAKLTAKRLQTAYKNKMPVIQVDEETDKLGRKIVQTSYMPIANTKHIKHAVLITETDITSIIIERERREKTLRQLLDVCVAIIDKRDPFSAGHSSLVGDLARLVAGELKLDDTHIETAEISGLLMNFGKVLVPQSILTKTTALTPEELKLVRDSMMSSADVLSLIQFEMPVVDTLRQVFERVDGTGAPEGRKGDDIIVTARICNAANSFVALVSRRAHREGMAIDRALEILRKDVGSIFDSATITALEAVVQSGQLQKQIDRVATQIISAA